MLAHIKSILHNNKNVKIRIVTEVIHYHGDYAGTPWILHIQLVLQHNKTPVLKMKSHDHSDNRILLLSHKLQSTKSCISLLQALVNHAESKSGTCFDFAKHGIKIPVKLYHKFYHKKISLFKPEKIYIKHHFVHSSTTQKT